MQIVEKTISVAELKKMSSKVFNRLVKTVVDIEKGIMVVDSDLQADQERFLLEECESGQKNLWGINLYPDLFGKADWIEFDSMINLRPSWGNKSRGVDDPKIQERIRSVVARLVTP